METIPYRRSKLVIQTIPKGTVLFRVSRRPQDDLRGVELPDGTRCIHRNYNVYFYPNPFVAEHSLHEWIKGNYKLHVFRLDVDVKVIRLLLPSRYHRNTKNTKRNFVKRCSKVGKGCMPNALRGYNPCLTEGFMTSHPDIVGMMAIAPRDANELHESFRRNKTLRAKRKYFHFATDAAGSESVPELILYPLRVREPADRIVRPDDVLETNYSLLHTFRGRQQAEVQAFMDTHTVYDPETFYYRYKA
jgi:hypothetical protein